MWRERTKEKEKVGVVVKRKPAAEVVLLLEKEVLERRRNQRGFTDHLYAALQQKGILTFRDDEELERGKSISPELLKAIEESRRESEFIQHIVKETL
ncbi:hypothetical protein SO802_014476 [Lithocarpus litseifolius]|uniref:TIR domain-containing protein n=1 Tax=Lithocarpus litseifolius TaxID=425828 RepID=A0AAW2CU38_9ROSI